MDQRQIVRMIAAARVAVGIMGLVAPRRAGALVFGPRGRDGAVAVMVRVFAGRDLVLGLGTLRALDRDADPAGWAKAAAAADALDATAAVLGLRAIPPARALLGATSAATVAALGARASTRLA
jgi:hypothetical protein